MDPDMRKLSLGLDKKIENLLIIIRSVGKPLHYVQQACISNLLVTVFAYFLQTQGPLPLF
jgi:hypothetical protein